MHVDEHDTPARQLVGMCLDNKWDVVEQLERPPGSTGGTFSTSYVVTGSDGKTKAFLKAMDYTEALQQPDPSRALQRLTEVYNFERDILAKCTSRRLSRIVRVLDSGIIPPRQNDPSSVVQYFIFELADGDIRSGIAVGEELDL